MPVTLDNKCASLSKSPRTNQHMSKFDWSRAHGCVTRLWMVLCFAAAAHAILATKDANGAALLAETRPLTDKLSYSNHIEGEFEEMAD